MATSLLSGVYPLSGEYEGWGRSDDVCRFACYREDVSIKGEVGRQRDEDAQNYESKGQLCSIEIHFGH